MTRTACLKISSKTPFATQHFQSIGQDSILRWKNSAPRHALHGRAPIRKLGRQSIGRSQPRSKLNPTSTMGPYPMIAELKRSSRPELPFPPSKTLKLQQKSLLPPLL